MNNDIVRILLNSAPSNGLGKAENTARMQALVNSVNDIQWALPGASSSYNQATGTLYIKQGLNAESVKNEFAHELGHDVFKDYQWDRLQSAYRTQNLGEAWDAICRREAMAVAYEYTSGLSSSTGYVNISTVQSIYQSTAASMWAGSSYIDFMTELSKNICAEIILQPETRQATLDQALTFLNTNAAPNNDTPPPPTEGGADLYSGAEDILDVSDSIPPEEFDFKEIPISELELRDDTPESWEMDNSNPSLHVRVCIDGELAYNGMGDGNPGSPPPRLDWSYNPVNRVTVWVAGELFSDDYHDYIPDAYSIAQRATYAWNLFSRVGWDVVMPGGVLDYTGLIHHQSSEAGNSQFSASQLIQEMSAFAAPSISDSTAYNYRALENSVVLAAQ